MKLAFSAFIKLIFGFAAILLLVFLPAGTFDYPNGWLLCAILFIPMLLLGVVLLIKSPAMLEKRLDMKEKVTTQKWVVTLATLMLVFGFISAGIDYRFSISHVPMPLVIAAAAMFLIGYALYCEVMRENAYLSRTVKVEEGQKVVSSGLYSIVRHPMYFATLFIFLAIPLVLASWISLAFFVFYPLIIIVRIIGEEKLLEKELGGYTEYKQKVKYRLIPFIW